MALHTIVQGTAARDAYEWATLHILGDPDVSAYTKKMFADAVNYANTYAESGDEAEKDESWCLAIIRNTDGFIPYPSAFQGVIDEAYANMENPN